MTTEDFEDLTGIVPVMFGAMLSEVSQMVAVAVTERLFRRAKKKSNPRYNTHNKTRQGYRESDPQTGGFLRFGRSLTHGVHLVLVIVIPPKLIQELPRRLIPPSIFKGVVLTLSLRG
jgi:hypothetical protein